FDALHDACVLTPHEGEFSRLFKLEPGLGRAEKARVAARLTGAHIVLKGADTIIAHPNCDVAINHHAPADLATAGSGDVLSGLIGGLLAQGMAAQPAACAAGTLHAIAAKILTRGLFAQDLPSAIPAVLQELAEMPRHITSLPEIRQREDEQL